MVAASPFKNINSPPNWHMNLWIRIIIVFKSESRKVGSFKNHDLYLDAVSTEKTSRTAFEAEIVEMTFFSANFGQFRDVSVYNPDAAE